MQGRTERGVKACRRRTSTSTGAVSAGSRQRFERVEVVEGCFFICPAWWSVYNLRYSYHRLYFVCDGEARYIEGDRQVPLKKGFLYVFPSQSKRYAIHHNPKSRCKCSVATLR